MTTRRRPYLAVLLPGVLILAAIRAPGGAASGGDPWGTVSIPGGFAALHDAVRLSAPADEWRTLPLLIEMSHAGVEGLRTSRLIESHASSLRQTRRQGGAAPGSGTGTVNGEAPLPLGVNWWTSRFDPAPPPGELLWAILASREMSSLYYGLLALDNETLRAVASDEALTRALLRSARVFPTVARAIRIHGGVVDAPGGTHAGELWHGLLNAPLTEPASFIDRLLRADDGRLAHFYATIDALPAEVVTSLMPSGSGEPARDAFRRLYSAFEAALGDWRADALVPPPADGPAELLFDLAVQKDGRLAGPPWRDFWRLAFETDAWPPPVSPPVDTRQVVDGATLIAAICPERCSVDRRRALALLQRVAPDPSAEDAAALLAAARVSARFPALGDEIGRMNLGEATAFERLGAVAARLERLQEPVRTVSLIQFQSAVAVLSRLRLAGAPADLITAHIGTLSSLPVTEQGYEGGVARWIGDRVFTDSGEAAPSDPMLFTLGGGPWQPAGALIEWEEIQYRVDLAATEAVRLRRVLDRLSVNAVPTAVALARLASDVPARIAAGDAAAVLAEGDATLAGASEVDEVWWDDAPAPLWSASKVRSELTSTLRGIRPSDSRRTERARRLLALSADAVAADALAALVYAFTLHDEQHPFLLGPDLSRRHRLHARSVHGRLMPWRPATVSAVEGVARLIDGSLLGLDAAMPELAMRRMESRRPAREPNMASTLAAGLRQTAALASPWLMTAGEVEAVALARARGERTVRAWSASGAAPDLDGAGISGPRAGWLRWSIARQRPLEDVLRIEDLVRLGLSRVEPGEARSTRPGSSCLMLPAVTSEARGFSRHARAATTEPALRVAVEVHGRRAPAAIVPGVLTLLVSDLIEQTTLPHPVDAAAVTEAVRRVPTERFDDYVAAVAARGVLVRVEDDRWP
jgi:hypothetical protein